MRVGILEPEGFSQRARHRLQTLGEVSNFVGESLPGFLQDKEVVFVRLNHSIDCGFLQMAPNLKFLCSPTTGLTHVDQECLEESGIQLISLKGQRDFLEGIRSTPEHALLLTLSILRKQLLALASVSRGKWDRDLFRGTDLYGLQVGVIGMGRVGMRYAEYVTALGADVRYFDPAGHPRIPATMRRHLELVELIEDSEVILLAADWVPGRLILDESLVRRLKGRFFVNVARGELVDEEALLELTSKGYLSGVALDVLTGEPDPRNLQQWGALMNRHNVIVTPHVGGATQASMWKTEEFVVELLLDQLGFGNGHS